MRVSGLVFASVCASTLLSVAAAGESAPAGDLANLLRRGWDRNLDALRWADGEAARLVRTNPSDPRLHYAYALVQLRHLRYAEAGESIRNLLAVDKRHLSALEAAAWLAVIQKEYDRAIKRIDELGETLAEQREGLDDRRSHNVASLLGGLFGFMEGPARERVDQNALQRTRIALIEKLSSAEQTALEAARQEVLKDFQGSLEETEVTAATAVLDAAERKDRVIEGLSNVAQQAAQQASVAGDQFDRVRQEAGYELERLSARHRELSEQLRRAELELARAESDATLSDARVAELVLLANQESDELLRQRYLREAAVWRVERDRWLVVAQGLARQRDGIRADGRAVERQASATRAKLKQVAQQVADAEKTAVRTQTELTKASNQPISGVTSQVLDQKRRSTALTSYVPLPISLEDERQKLIDSLQ
ncbi:MAG: hypothetical protein ACOY3P_15800 [Planctomycetota bacterium]